MCVSAKETDDQVLALRHSGFGWLGFQLSAKTARAMATALLNGSSRSSARSWNDGACAEPTSVPTLGTIDSEPRVPAA